MSEPRLLLLDEPATGLDVAAREHLLDTVDALRLRRPGLGSVMVTHHLEDLPTSTSHAMLLRDGAVVAQGPADRVITSSAVSHAFDFPLAVVRTEGRWHAHAGRPDHRSRPGPPAKRNVGEFAQRYGAARNRRRCVLRERGYAEPSRQRPPSPLPAAPRARGRLHGRRGRP